MLDILGGIVMVLVGLYALFNTFSFYQSNDVLRAIFWLYLGVTLVRGGGRIIASTLRELASKV